jgi:hypothetical protein
MDGGNSREMTTQELATTDPAQVLESVVLKGDLKDLSPAQRVTYYRQVCESLGLNPFTKPFEYITLNGKLTLYARRDATDQLRQLHGVSVTRLERERHDDLAIVVAHGIDKTGRTDSAIGAVPTKGLTGEALANALMKAETKAKRRLTLSMCGLGWTDESEVESIPDAQPVAVDHATGELAGDGGHLVRSADHKVWQRYLWVLSEAQGLGIRAKPLELPCPLATLIGEGRRLTGLINKRKIEAAKLPVASDRMVEGAILAQEGATG